jgi:arginine decarboxylase
VTAVTADGVIHISTGVGAGPTDLAAYDAALAAVNVHDYNLVAVSSVIPPGATIRQVEEIPPLGAAGGRLFVVESVAVDAGDVPVAAILGWTDREGQGLFYEATGTDLTVVRERVDVGIEAGCRLRGWQVPPVVRAEAVDPPTDAAAHAVVCIATYGEAEPML